MSVRNLDHLFRPKSIAVVGASNQPRSVGAVVVRNLLSGEFSGPILPVNPHETSIAGVFAYNDLESLPVAPDLAVICTPPKTVPSIIAELGQRGTKAAVILTAGLSQQAGDGERTLQDQVLESARPNLMRILGPNCVGVMLPRIGVNASFGHRPPLAGNLAFVAQSGALCTSVLDWAASHGIGFSSFVSVGDMADIDFGDLLDYLGADADTSAILLYIESIGPDEARKFMSAARAAARNKPVLVIKSGRESEGAKAAASHTGALAGSDDVYDAAFRRAGMLRVFDMGELFDAVETLARVRPYRGDRLAIVTNGGGPGVLATDSLVRRGGRLAELSEESLRALNEVLPPIWSHGNPIDIIGDATGERYGKALEIVTRDPGVDAVLVMNVPTAIASSEDAARCVIETLRDSRLPVFTAWLGEDGVASARRMLREAGLPTYETPDDAVRAFVHTVDYRRNQEALIEIPPSAPDAFDPNHDEARRIIERALREEVEILSEPDAKSILAAYGIPVVETRVATSTDQAVALADELGYPVAIKIISPQITHKSDVGGVQLDLETPDAVRSAAGAMRDRVKAHRPDAEVQGFSVQQMARRRDAEELILGVTTDPIFGPVILFGQGGKAVEVIADRAVALPPLNMKLAKDLIDRTRVAKLLRGYRDRPAAALDAICMTLVQLSQLVIDQPEIAELDINPLFADESGVLALDARVRVTPSERFGADRLAIRPYPKELEESIDLDGNRLLLRPIRPEDQPAHQTFISKLTQDDLHVRFFSMIRELPQSQMARLTQIDYDREMAFIATNAGPKPETLGVVRVVADPDNIVAEFAIIVRSDWKGRGLGRALLEKIVNYCRDRGTKEIVGDILAGNRAMINLAQELGFQVRQAHEPELVRATLEL